MSDFPWKLNKGESGDGTFDVGGGGPAFIFGLNLTIFLLHAKLVIEIPKIKSNLNFDDL